MMIDSKFHRCCLHPSFAGGWLLLAGLACLLLCSCRSNALLHQAVPGIDAGSTVVQASPSPAPAGNPAAESLRAPESGSGIVRGNNSDGPFDQSAQRRSGNWNSQSISRAAAGTYEGYPTTIAPPVEHFSPPSSTLPYAATYHPPVGQDGHWSPPGLAKLWPRDEYICDGGDRNVQVRVGHDFRVGGLDIQDTVGHFDTLDGRTVVEPTNCVCIYAPRFAAVRKINGVIAHEGHRQTVAVDRPTPLYVERESLLASTTVQQLQPEARLGTKRSSTFRDRTRGLTVELPRAVTELTNRFMPYEDFRIIRLGQFDQTEKPRLTEWIDAAQVWESEQAVQVLVDNESVVVQRGITRPEVSIGLKYEGKPKLCVVKVASTKHAHPGDIVSFTLRLDNRGTELIGNVTLIDNLTTRLEYIDGSAECSLDAKFFSQENEAESLVLRWEITDPIPPGKGGVIRFKCRVR